MSMLVAAVTQRITRLVAQHRSPSRFCSHVHKRAPGAQKGALRSRESTRTFSSGGSGGRGSGMGGGGGDGDSGSPFNPASLWSIYLKMIEEHPWPTKIATSAALNAAGDFLGQVLFEKDKAFDWQRFAKFTFLGGALVAPVLGIWYSILNSAVPSTGVAAAIGKTLLDQGVFAPCFVALFISSLLCLDGTPDLVVSKLKQDLIPTVVANWSLWIPGQLLNFYFVPPSLTLLCSNFIALIWCTYLSWAANKKVDHKYSSVSGDENAH